MYTNCTCVCTQIARVYVHKLHVCMYTICTCVCTQSVRVYTRSTRVYVHKLHVCMYTICTCVCTQSGVCVCTIFAWVRAVKPGCFYVLLYKCTYIHTHIHINMIYTHIDTSHYIKLQTSQPHTFHKNVLTCCDKDVVEMAFPPAVLADGLRTRIHRAKKRVCLQIYAYGYVHI
jgi:hypothetical protein